MLGELLELLCCLRADKVLCLARVYLSLFRTNFKDVLKEVLEDVLPHVYCPRNSLTLGGEREELVLVLDDKPFCLERFKVNRRAAGCDIEIARHVSDSRIPTLLS